MPDGAAEEVKKTLRKRHSVAHSYQLLFTDGAGALKPEAKVVLTDLGRFCRFLTPTLIVAKDGHTDIPATFHAEGRREVFLRLQAQMKVDLGTLIRAITEVEDHGRLTADRRPETAD
jgi:hypothetical protein